MRTDQEIEDYGGRILDEFGWKGLRDWLLNKPNMAHVPELPLCKERTYTEIGGLVVGFCPYTCGWECRGLVTYGACPNGLTLKKD